MEQQAESTTESTISTEQVDQYFESGGEADIDTIDTEQENTQQQAPESQEETKEKYVPYGAMHEERMKRKELQGQLESTAQRMAQMEQGWNRLMGHMQKQQQPQAPTFDEDPLEALRHDNEQMKRYLQQQHMTQQQQQQVYEVEQRKHQFINNYRNQAQEFAKAQPEFSEAYQYLSESRISEYLAAGYTPEQATQLLHDDEMAIAAKAFQDGVNPAERLLSLAKTRGFKPASQGQQASQKVQQMNKGVQMSKSLNGAGGKSSSDISLDSLASMDNDEFESFVSKNWDKVAKMMR